MSTEQNPASSHKPSPRNLPGLMLLISGATLLGLFITRQLKEAGSGHTYFGFIVLGGVLLSLGIIITARSRKTQ